MEKFNIKIEKRKKKKPHLNGIVRVSLFKLAKTEKMA
jgi:hypothetical protein